MKAEIRKDYLLDKYVLIAPKRDKRPHDIERPEKLNPQTSSCVFCPQEVNKKKALLTLGPKDRWYVKVIPNDFPAVSVDNQKAYGRQEVVIETPNHIVELEDLPVEHIERLFEAYAKRIKDISKDRKIEYILTFKNNGGRAGASLQHAHSQIFSTAFLPPDLFEKSQKAAAYRLKNGSCPYCDVIQKERETKRFIWEDDHAIAFTPYASAYNYEAWIMPKAHRDNIASLRKNERKSMATILKQVLRKIGDLQLPYNYFFHQVIHDKEEHLILQVAPRGSVWAGVELGSGLIVNTVRPEEAAAYYREGYSL